MGLIKFKDIKRSSVYITPNLPVIQTKRYKFNLRSILGILFAYTFFVIIVVITILALTPAKEMIFILENEELTKQADRITELENEVLMLTRNLNAITANNKRLNFAMILAGTDSLDSTAAIYDSLKTDPEDSPFGGNILMPVKKLWKELFSQQEDKLFFVKPSKGVIINPFNINNGHFGVDFGVKEGTPVYAAAGGLVLFSGFKLEDGYTIIIQHKNNIISIYKHCSLLAKKEREYVSQGELIALSGNSGYNSSGAHLHFELWQEGKTVDPTKFLIN